MVPVRIPNSRDPFADMSSVPPILKIVKAARKVNSMAGFARERASEEKKHAGNFFLLSSSDFGMELFFHIKIPSA